MRRFLVAALALSSAAGCLNNLEPLPLGVTIAAFPAAPTVGATVTFTVQAQGLDLVQVDLVYGDGTSETQLTGFARTAQLTRPHVYEAAGTYEAAATVTDAAGAQRTATLEIVVQ